MRNRIVLTLFIAALACFTAFHFFPWSTGSDLAGWQIWRFVVRIPTDWEVQNLLPTFGFLSSGLLLAASPFLVPVFEASRLARNLILLGSALAAISLTGFIAWLSIDQGGFSGASGMISMMFAQIFHVAGMVAIKRPPPPSLPG